MSNLQCAFNGEKGAFADVAVHAYFGNGVESLPVQSFDEVFACVESGRVAFGMVPIENSTTGSIYQNYDNFSHHDGVVIAGALAVRISHALLVPSGTSLSDIRTVYSHPQGFYQCSRFLKQYDWNLVESVSTASGAKTVGALNDHSCAAIADRCNAGLYNLEVLKESIEDNPDNYTRFVVLACHNGKYERCPEISGKGMANKVSFTFTTQNKVGALYDCLCVCKDAGLNLTKLESRPISGCPWSYRFFADAAIPSGSDGPEHAVASFTEMLRKVTEEIRILGVYRE